MINDEFEALDMHVYVVRIVCYCMCVYAGETLAGTKLARVFY